MRPFRLLPILAGMALSVIPVFAQTPARDAIAEDVLRAGGVYYMYPFKAHKVTQPPKGYKTVYLSHYGRHGARYLLNETQYERSLGVLRDAHEKGALTDTGEKIWETASAYFEETCQYRAGDLTPLGFEQHYRIAQDIYKDNRAFFKQHPAVTAGATQVPRCIVSMAAFCQGLAAMDPTLDIYENASRFDLDELNPHAKENPRRENVQMEEGRYKRTDPWGTKLGGFIDARVDYKAIASRIFKDPNFPKPYRGTRAFVTDFYDLVFNMQCTGTQRSLLWFFTPEECYALWEVNNYIHYMEAAPPATMRDLPALQHLVADADAALAAGKPAARLRFGHDTCLLFLLSAFGADGFGIVPDSADEISATWFNWRAPMAATFYLAFCRNKKGDVLVKLVWNGEEATLPVAPVSGPWYRWSDVKAMLTSSYSAR